MQLDEFELNLSYFKIKKVWDATSDAYISFQDENISNLALIVENDLIQASLTRMLPKYENVKVMHSNQVDQFKTIDQCVDIQLKDNKKVKTNLLIGSDGANSFIRDKANFAVTKWNYDQMAIVATLKLPQVLKKWRLLFSFFFFKFFFLQESYQWDCLAALFVHWTNRSFTSKEFLIFINKETKTVHNDFVKLSDEYSSLVWSIKKNLAKELMELSDDEFAHRVNQAFVSSILFSL